MILNKIPGSRSTGLPRFPSFSDAAAFLYGGSGGGKADRGSAAAQIGKAQRQGQEKQQQARNLVHHRVFRRQPFHPDKSGHRICNFDARDPDDPDKHPDRHIHRRQKPDQGRARKDEVRRRVEARSKPAVGVRFLATVPSIISVSPQTRYRT